MCGCGASNKHMASVLKELKHLLALKWSVNLSIQFGFEFKPDNKWNVMDDSVSIC